MLRLGSLALSNRAVQAALSGYSDRAMRMVSRRFGAEYCVNEVMLDVLVLQQGKARRRALHVGADDHPIGGQLMGAEPSAFGAAANDLVEAGYDVIDINFGCPVRKVLGRCRGGWLLSEPDKALGIVRSVIDAVAGRRPVTLKLRRGFDDSPESERDFWTILDGAFAAGVAAVTVHGRTVKQKYVGPSRWDFLAAVKRRVGRRTVIGSGDLFTADDVLRMIEETGVDGASVARGAIGNPFVFRECRERLAGRPLPPPATVAEQRDALLLHLSLARELHGDERAGVFIRKFGIHYADLHPDRDSVRQAFIDARTTDDVERVIRGRYAEDGPGRRRAGLRDLVAAGASLSEE